MEFENLPLHDATLSSITYDWQSSTACVIGSYCNEASGCIEKFVLKFSDANFVGIPHREDWGSSSQINSTVSDGDEVFNLEMQSGDIISFKAKGFSFE